MGDIEKQREEVAQVELGGTMFDPSAGLGVSRQGRQHFIEHNAEALLGEMKYEDAWDYLSDPTTSPAWKMISAPKICFATTSLAFPMGWHACGTRANPYCHLG